MNRTKLLQIIQKNLDELSEINQEMNRDSQPSKFEVELALNKARLLLQEYEFLQEICQQETTSGEMTKTEKAEVEPATSEPVVQPQPKKTEVAPSVYKTPTPSPVKEMPKHEPVTEKPEPTKAIEEEPEEVEVEIPQAELVEVPIPEKDTVLPNEVVQPTKVDEPVAHEIETPQNGSAAHKKTVTDQFVSKSLNDLLTASNKLDHRFASSPIAKLENAIGLNDRFQYIRELFQNDADGFRETISKLDRMHTLEEALAYLDSKFNWEKTDTSLQFMHLVKRRFSNLF
ncbi:hypothetical protein [Mangrovibacterium diazotrophicum]|uniref:Uncharacterized protein n=1 Tax=Mangrovibacterium diazotrophicum TaxID=1261403 RepID=A0A419WBJ0_9BACT|nr:hypothetical protein [Mangrovibacterium diazotrophicum]RKD92794.1 hypothetical protein BC643_3171 [Mangrovibacterium diazotrophicum]